MELKQMIELLDTDVCDYCIHSDECSRGIVCYGGDPIEPRCCNEKYEEILDIEAIKERIKEDEM